MQRMILDRSGAERAQDCAIKFGWPADLAAQAYFQALRRKVSSQRDDFGLGIAENFSERILLSHIRNLNDALCQMARAGRWHACAELWDQALKLTSTFSELAPKNPEPFKRKARVSLVMPSLRVPPSRRKSRNGRDKWIDTFLGDAPHIAKAIELSADTIGAKISDNRVLLGALCARLVGECVHEIKRARSLWSVFFTPYGKTVVWPTERQIRPFASQTHDQLIAGMKLCRDRKPDAMERHVRMFCLLAECGVERLHFLLLPDLTPEQAKVWWKNAIEKMIESKFDALLQEPAWMKELKDVSTGTRADMLRKLKDYSREKVKQFA
jgi:hypothetical protein